MSKTFIFLGFLGLGIFTAWISHSDTEILKDQLQGGGASDLLGVTKTKDFLKEENKARVKFSMTCVDSTGRSLAKADAGYEDCLRNSARGNPSSPTKQSLPQASVGYSTSGN